MGTPERTVFGVGRNGSPPGHWSDVLWPASVVALPAIAALVSRMRAIDLAYHVRAGEVMLRTGALLRRDPFTFTVGGRPWRNQQWGAQLLLGSAHRIAGWAGIAVTYAAALGAGFSLLYRSGRRSGADARTAAVLTILGFLVAAGSLGARPQALAVPLFTGTWLLLQRRDAWSWLVPLVAACWANVHGSFVLAPVLTAFALAEDVIDRRAPARTGAVLVLTVAATLLTPFGPAVWAYAWDVARDETIRTTVAEWRPPSPLTGPGALFWLSGLAVVVAGALRRTRVRPIDVARLLLFFVLGAAAVRSTLWWALAAPPVVAAWFPATSSAEAPAARRPRVVLVVATAAVALVLASRVRSGVDPATGAPARLDADAPQTLVDASRRALPAVPRLLVFQPFASWFEHSLPGYPVMVDSRIELFPEDVWDDYDAAIVAGDRWREVTMAWRVDGVALPPGAVLTEHLRDDPEWRAVAENQAGSVFVRS